MLDNLIEAFRDDLNVENYFSYLSFEVAMENILNANDKIVLLLGESGSGKSFLLHLLKHKYPERFILHEDPFMKKTEFLSKYEDELEGKTILIDEAQLLSSEMVEYFFKLKEKGNQVVFSMNMEDGKEILKSPLSRKIKKIILKPLSYEEFDKYVSSQLMMYQEFDLITKRNLKKIYKLTKGNFRLIKKFMQVALELLDYSLENSLKYKKIDSCIIEMTSIELGLVK